MKTIKQIAGEIGVSKQAVQQRLNKPPLVNTAKPLLTNVDGAWRVPPKAEALILAAFSNAPTSKSTSVADNLADKQPTSVVGELVSMLQEQLTVKDAQLMEKDKQLAAMQQALTDTTAALVAAQQTAQAAQALHAGTMHKQLKEPSPGEAAAVEVAQELPEQEPTAEPEPRRGIFSWFSKKK